MIEVIDCPLCLSTVPKCELFEHQILCSSMSNQRSDSSKSVKSDGHRVKLNVQLMKQYMSINKLKQTLINDIKNSIRRQFDGQVNQIWIILNNQETYIDFQTSLSSIERGLLADQLRQIAQNYINSYQVISFTIDPSQYPHLDELQDQYILQQSKSQIYFIAKKDQILWKVVRFFETLTQKNKAHRKMKLGSEILEIQSEKQKQLQQIIKSINLFIANSDQVIIKVKNIGKNCLVIISGLEETVNVCKQHIEQSLAADDLDISYKRLKLSEQDYKVITKAKILQNYKQNYGVKFEVKTYNILRIFKASKNSSVYLISNPSILAFPKQTVIILPEAVMKQVKQFQQSIQSFKQHVFFSPQEGKTVLKAFSEFVNYYVQSQSQIGLILPEKNIQTFIQGIIDALNKCDKSIKVYVLQRNDQSAAIRAFEESTMKQKRWYVTIKGQKNYYPQNVCESIQSAIFNGIQTIVITNQDLNITKITHTYNQDQGQITHKGTGNVNYVQDQVDQLVVFVQDFHFFAKKKKKKAVQLTFAVFQLNLTQKTQQNLISGNKYKMGCQMTKKDNASEMELQKTELQLVIKYPDADTIDMIWNQIKTHLYKNKIMKKFEREGVSNDKLKQIEDWARLNKIQINIEDNQIVAYSYNQAVINNLQKLIQLHKKRLSGPIQYPKYWQIDQRQQFTMHTVSHETEEFQYVQNKFKVGKISKLERIQNKILFQKYNNQKIFLKQLSGAGAIRQLMMYHGTRANNPELIYADREQSFNINYANTGSYGKGIYFAKNSEYSNNYCYNSRGGKQMFYCIVLAGNSQIYNGRQQFDTSFRDPVKKIRYQSVVNSKNEDILVVFKNRRAYPLYLITYG